MRSTLYATPAAAEQAFYDAFERGDCDAMMAVWDDSPDIVCIHPLGPRLQGRFSIQESWRQIFGGGARLRFRISAVHHLHQQELSIRVVQENITVLNEVEQPAQPLLVTNAYRRTARGWRMVLHHASPGQRARELAPASQPHRLH